MSQMEAATNGNFRIISKLHVGDPVAQIISYAKSTKSTLSSLERTDGREFRDF